MAGREMPDSPVGVLLSALGASSLFQVGYSSCLPGETVVSVPQMNLLSLVNSLQRDTTKTLQHFVFIQRGKKHCLQHAEVKTQGTLCDDIRPVRNLPGSPLVYKVAILGSGNQEPSCDFGFSGQAGVGSSLYSFELGLAALTAQVNRRVRKMGLSAREVTAKIHLNWCGMDDVKVNFFSQWRETGALYLTPK